MRFFDYVCLVFVSRMNVSYLFCFYNVYSDIVFMIVFFNDYIFVNICIRFYKNSIMVFYLYCFVSSRFICFYGYKNIMIMFVNVFFLDWLVVIECVVDNIIIMSYWKEISCIID